MAQRTEKQGQTNKTANKEMTQGADKEIRC